MAQTTYQVILSTDGKHTVIATSDDPGAVKDALTWARVTYDAILGRYGSKYEQSQRGGKREAEVVEDETPTCAVHHLPMVRQEGKHGAFWSCHQRDSAGSFCSYRPPRR